MLLNQYAISGLIFVALAVPAAARADEALEQLLREKLAGMDCPGALVGIFPEGGPAEHYVLGVADRETKASMREGFHMRIASITKMFVGTMILQLLDEGKLSLDDPISKYVDSVPNGDAITLRQLGNNTSGLFNSIENKEFQAAIVKEPHREWQPHEILAYAFVNPPYHAPGDKFRYSNTNAVLLGMVIEKVEAAPLAEVVRRRVCEPLGLHDTGICVGGTPAKPYPSAYRNGYEDKWIGYGATPYVVTDYSASWTGAAGNMYSTLEDLAKAAVPLATGQLLGEAGQRELSLWVPTETEGIDYGYCLFRDHGKLGHMGDVPGYQAVLSYDPELKRTLIVLTNLSNNKDETLPAEELAKLVNAYLDHSSDATAKSP